MSFLTLISNIHRVILWHLLSPPLSLIFVQRHINIFTIFINSIIFQSTKENIQTMSNSGVYDANNTNNEPKTHCNKVMNFYDIEDYKY